MANKQQSFDLEPKKPGPIECLGMTFENDEARRAYFLERLKEKLQDPEFRKIPGFPKGTDEDILRMSDPPYYTACPNPFLRDFVAHHGRDADPSTAYSRRPYTADVTESRNNPFVNAHSYATKAPHQAIMRYLLNYTNPGDLVFDGFSGTGMTAVAAQLLGQPSPDFRVQIEQEWVEAGLGKPEWGTRTAIIGDLSPAATFISSNLLGADDLSKFAREAEELLSQLEEECGWMYRTRHSDGVLADIDCTIWSDVFLCPDCSSEVVFWEVAVDLGSGVLRSQFCCPQCGVELGKRGLPRVFENRFDLAIGTAVKRPKQVPVSIVYRVNGKKYEKKPDAWDFELLDRINSTGNSDWYPSLPMMLKGERWGDTWRAGYHEGLTHIHHFFTHRNLQALSRAWKKAGSHRLKFMLTSLMYKSSVLCSPLMSNYFAEHSGRSRGGWVGKERSGTLFRPSICSEVSIMSQIRTRMISTALSARQDNAICIQTASATHVDLPDNSLDYIFIDPPFGANRYYSELNFLWEAWLGVLTDQTLEAVESPSQAKKLHDYQGLMERSFRECYRILKPGRWITIEFSNTSAAVWNSIQTALTRAGFVVACVRALHKGQGSINAYTTPTAVRQDLVISAYKPERNLEEQCNLIAGSDSSVWGFVRSYLEHLPVFGTSKEGRAEVIAERLYYVIFDRMVAFHVQRGIAVPLSAPEFYVGLKSRFADRDGMYFLPEQVADYDRQRLSVKEVAQLQLFVTDESSAIQWVRLELDSKPQSFQDLTPAFMREIQTWAGHEKTIELKDILEENFLMYDGNGPVPAQIHTYLSTNFRDMRGLSKDDPVLRAKASDRWYVPDPNKQADLEQLRTKRLLKEFMEYKESKQKKIKLFRTEAIRAGFKAAYAQKDYGTIVEVAKKLPEQVIQEDEKLLMYFDVASMRLGED